MRIYSHLNILYRSWILANIYINQQDFPLLLSHTIPLYDINNSKDPYRWFQPFQ
jgi:hypothetical protein